VTQLVGGDRVVLGLAAGGRRGTAALEPGDVPQAEQAHCQAGHAGPDPPAAAGGQAGADDQQDDEGDGPARRDHGGDELIVRLKGRRLLLTFLLHTSQATRRRSLRGVVYLGHAPG
jgi:hypothetical protein